MNALSKPTFPNQAESAELHVTGLTAGYGGPPIIRDVTLTVQSRQIVGLIGPNGAGKSTLLKAIAGVIRSQSGSVHYRDREITNLRADTLLRQGIAYVPQLKDVFPNLSVADNLDMGAYLYRKDREIRKEEVLATFPVLKPRLNQRATTLSGGERKTLALAKALMARPRVLLLDEPSAALSPQAVSQLWDHVLHLREAGITFLIVEQKAKSLLAIADWAYVLVNGQTVMDQAAAALLQLPDLGQVFLGQKTGNVG